jgi:antitoxin component YwqK of YwqJK toxin-antitoxin module
MNSPNNNNIYSISLRKIYCCLLLSVIGFSVFGQDEVDPNGYNVFYYSSGEIASEGLFKNGLPEGVWKSYYPSGVIKSIGNKVAGQSDSLWQFFDKDGLLTATYEYANDLKNGCARQFDSLGTVTQEAFYIDDKKQGEELWYFADGSVQKQLVYQDGDVNGIVLEYNEDGIVITEQEYSNGHLRRKEEFNRYDDDGKKTGVWRDYFDNGNIKTEINYRGGKKDGITKEFDEDGKLIDISTMKGDSLASDPGGVVIIDLYKEYHPNGKVKLVGGLNKGLKSGIFREYDIDGQLLQGYVYKNDTLLSEGMILAGGIFQGEWKTYYLDGQIKSKGSYEKGRKNGKWIFYYTDGNKEQEGNFKDDVLSGQWVWYYQNGQIKKQEFFNRKGLLEGVQVEYDSLGAELSKGEYYNGQREGAWFYHVGDHKEVGAFSLGEPEGRWNHYYFNGKIAFTGEYSEGEPKGKHIYYYKNGLRKRYGKYAGGEKHGIWRMFNKNGDQIETIHYKRGEIYKINGFRVNEVELEE